MFSLTFLFDFLDCLMAARWPLCLRALNIMHYDRERQ